MRLSHRSLMSLVMGTVLVGCTPAVIDALQQAAGKGAAPVVPAATAAIDEETPDPQVLAAALDLNKRAGLVRKAPSATGQRIAVARARRVAQNFLRSRQGQVEEWPGASLAAAEPTAFQDGVETQPAAFEFIVQGASGKPQGRIVVATSPYVAPVPEFATEGATHQADLEAQYRRKFGKLPQSPIYYRFSAFAYALEDAANPQSRVVKGVGAFDFARAKAGKRRFGYYADDEAAIRNAWTTLDRDTTVGGLSTKAVTRVRISGTVPPYYQQDIGDCVVGCVPVAWGMIYGYYEQKGLDTIPGSPASNLTQNAAVEAMTRKIHEYCQTECNNGAGSTNSLKAYLGRKWGRQDRNLTVRTNFDQPDSDAKLYGRIKAEIDEGRPVLLGFKDNLNPDDADLEGHAVVATGYDESGSQAILVNTGWQTTPTMFLTIGSGELNLSGIVKITVK